MQVTTIGLDLAKNVNIGNYSPNPAGSMERTFMRLAASVNMGSELTSVAVQHQVLYDQNAQLLTAPCGH